MTAADLVIRNGKVVSPDSVIDASVAIKDGAVIAVGADAAMPPARETLDAQGHAPAARRDRRACAFPRSGLSAQRGFRERHRGGGVRRRHHGVRHAKHDPADRHAGHPRGQARDGGREGARRLRALRPARRGHHRACAGAGQGRDRLQALHGQHVRRDSIALDRCDAGMLRGRGADRQARFAARRDQLDHGAARIADARCRPRRSRSRISRRGRPWLRSRRSAAPRSLPNGPARASTSCTSRPPKNCGRCAKPRRAASISPARPARTTCCCRPTTMRASPASSASIRRCAKRATRSRCGRRSTDGTIDAIATDHAPHSREEKTRNDIWTVDCGFPGVETQMPLMLTEAAAGRFSVSDYVRWSSCNPAKIWGLYPRKGVIQPGADADIAVVDLAPRMDDRRRQAAIAAPGSRRSMAARSGACRSIRWCAAAL